MPSFKKTKWAYCREWNLGWAALTSAVDLLSSPCRSKSLETEWQARQISQLGPVSWRPTTVKWRQFSQSNRHSPIGTRQTEYHEALPSSSNDEVRCDCTFADDGKRFTILGLLSADGGMTVGLWRLSSLDGRRPPWYRPLGLQLGREEVLRCLRNVPY